MPRTGMEPIRRKAIIEAAISTIGERGNLDVTVSQIARSAGVSAALAHHYFGGKEQIFLATMRHLLRAFGQNVAGALAATTEPRARLSAVIRESFGPDQFAPSTIAAWLAFYVRAPSDDQAHRLLNIYARRLNSNLVDALDPLCAHDDARRIAEGVAALIDGLYIRRALHDGRLHDGADPASAIALVERYVDTELSALARPVKKGGKR